MYFAKMKENIDIYSVDVKLLRSHFQLIFQNAFDYNKPKDRPYKDAERIQEIMNKLIDRKWDGLVRKQEMTIEEQEHQKWVKGWIKKDPKFLETSEEIEIIKHKFRFELSKRKLLKKTEVNIIGITKTKEPATSTIALSNNDQNESNDQSSIEAISSAMSARLRKRKAMRYIDEDQSSYGREEAKSKIYNEAKKVSSKGAQGPKNKNSEYVFTSDEEMEEFKKQTKFDLKKLGEYPYKAKHLLEKPEELEDLDIKQYYDNPVRC